MTDKLMTASRSASFVCSSTCVVTVKSGDELPEVAWLVASVGSAVLIDVVTAGTLVDDVVVVVVVVDVVVVATVVVVVTSNSHGI